MPLNREMGEVVGEFGAPTHVAKPEEWKDYLVQLRVPYEVRRHNKWKVETKTRPIIEDMAEKAGEAFAKLPFAILPITFSEDSFLVQEHHDKGVILILAQHRIGIEEHFVVLPYMLTRGQVGWLKTTGRWKDRTKH